MNSLTGTLNQLLGFATTGQGNNTDALLPFEGEIDLEGLLEQLGDQTSQLAGGEFNGLFKQLITADKQSTKKIDNSTIDIESEEPIDIDHQQEDLTAAIEEGLLSLGIPHKHIEEIITRGIPHPQHESQPVFDIVETGQLQLTSDILNEGQDIRGNEARYSLGELLHTEAKPQSFQPIGIEKSRGTHGNSHHVAFGSRASTNESLAIKDLAKAPIENVPEGYEESRFSDAAIDFTNSSEQVNNSTESIYPIDNDFKSSRIETSPVLQQTLMSSNGAQVNLSVDADNSDVEFQSSQESYTSDTVEKSEFISKPQADNIKNHLQQGEQKIVNKDSLSKENFSQESFLGKVKSPRAETPEKILKHEQLPTQSTRESNALEQLAIKQTTAEPDVKQKLKPEFTSKIETLSAVRYSSQHPPSNEEISSQKESNLINTGKMSKPDDEHNGMKLTLDSNPIESIESSVNTSTKISLNRDNESSQRFDDSMAISTEAAQHDLSIDNSFFRPQAHEVNLGKVTTPTTGQTIASQASQGVSAGLGQATANGQATVNMILNPEELGTVRVQLTHIKHGELGQANLHARLVVSTAEAHDMLVEKMDTLKQTLGEQNVQLDNLSIVVADSQSASKQGQEQRQQFNQQFQHGQQHNQDGQGSNTENHQQQAEKEHAFNEAMKRHQQQHEFRKWMSSRESTLNNV